MSIVMPVTIALVMAIVAGAVVWLVWSVIENLMAKRTPARGSPTTTPATESDTPKPS
ncbi:MAG: hypothetical protein HUU46_13155 [Candidatus Hydrogenedentes bacterium]|nr:hypothetical protein [Candidatus Hydrogenedentota bacterium]